MILLFSVPSGPPRNVKTDSATSTSFTLTWDPPLEPNGIILGYVVMYYECDEPDKKNIHDNINERKQTIKDLHPYRCYRMLVACKSSGGLGAYSNWVERWTKPGGERGVKVLSSLCALRKHTFRTSSKGLSVRTRYLGRRRLFFFLFSPVRWRSSAKIFVLFWLVYSLFQFSLESSNQ